MPGKQTEQDRLKSWLTEHADAKILQKREVKSSERDVSILYVEELVDAKKLEQDLIRPCFELSSMQTYEDYLHFFPKTKQPGSDEDVMNDLLNGFVLMFLPSRTLLVDLRKYEASGIQQASLEKTVQGPHDALSENPDVSLNMIRNRYRTSSLEDEIFVLGEQAPTKVTLLYDKRLAKPEIVEEMRKRLQQANPGLLHSVGQLSKYINQYKWSLFPSMAITERPDRVARNLADGKLVLLVENNPTALVAPAVFFDFFASMDDIYSMSIVSRFLLVLRYIGLFTATLLPALYVSVAAYTPELFRVQLALSIAGSRISVPFPAYFEVLFMLVIMEMLVEASVRLPSPIGSTATTVGGLILGQAATQAGLVSDIMIIIVSSVAISNFIIPINAMGFAIRVLKYPFIGIAIFFGPIGIALGAIGIVFYVAQLRSLGQPYLKIFSTDHPRKTKVGLGEDV